MRRKRAEYRTWLIDRCGWCGLKSWWATDGRGNLFCAKCGH
jgi:hypothetical protein